MPDRSMAELEPQNEEAPTLLDFLILLLKYKKMIVLMTSSLTLVAVLYCLSLPNIYTAKAMILPGDDDKGMMMGGMLAQMGLASMAGAIAGPTKTDLYVTMLKTETVKDPIIDRFKLLEVYEAKLRSDAYKALDDNVVIAAGKRDGVLSISVDDQDPKRAAAIANGYVEELGKVAAGLSMTGASKNRVFLERRLATANADLLRAENAMKAFQTKNKAISITDQAKASIEGVALLRGQLAAQEVQLGTIQRQFTDSSQEVKVAKAAVANIKKQIAMLEGSSGDSSIPSVGSMPQLGQEYVQLLREFKIQETLVELLTKQYEMVKLTEIKDVSPFQVLQTAKVPERKSKPVRSKIVQGALLVSLMISVGLAWVLEWISRVDEEKKQHWKRSVQAIGGRR